MLLCCWGGCFSSIQSAVQFGVSRTTLKCNAQSSRNPRVMRCICAHTHTFTHKHILEHAAQLSGTILHAWCGVSVSGVCACVCERTRSWFLMVITRAIVIS